MKNFDDVEEGDIVMNEITGQSFQVVCIIDTIDKSLLASRTIHIQNPSKWKLIAKAVRIEDK